MLTPFSLLLMVTAALRQTMSESVTSNDTTARLNSFSAVVTQLFPLESADFEFRFADDHNELKIIRVHKRLLSIISPVFAAMFGVNWNTRDSVVVTDASFGPFKEFIQAFYKNEVNITDANIGEILNLAKKYQLDDLVPDCALFLEQSLTADNCIDALNLATAFDMGQLQTECDKLIGADTKAILVPPALHRCSLNALKAILGLEAISCTEFELFGIAVEWAEHQCEENGLDATDANNLGDQLGVCLDKIRFNEMALAEVISCIETYGPIFSKEQIFGFLKYFNGTTRADNCRQKVPSKGRDSE